MAKPTTKKKSPKGGGAQAKKRPAKKKKRAAKKPERSPRITAEQYNGLWHAYRRLQNIGAAAKEVGVDYTTAEKYIKGPGAPEHGMVPIRERYLKVQARAQEEQELDLLTFRQKEQTHAMNQLSIIHGEMQLCFADVKKRLDKLKRNKKNKNYDPERELGIKDLVVAYDKAARLVEHLLGGADVTIAGQVTNDPLKALNPDEALEYATTGKLPADIETALAARRK